MARTTDKIALNDALADTALDTLELYKEHMRNGRYEDAKQCLAAVGRITEDVTVIEDHDNNMVRADTIFNIAASPNREADSFA